MAIPKADLEKMNDLLSKGETISNIRDIFPRYDYWDIYWEVNNYSFLGKKRMITNRIKKIATEKTAAKRKKLADETKTLLDELYYQLKINSKKLIRIDKILRN